YKLIVPLLDKLFELNQRFLDPRTEIQILGKAVDGLIAINPLLITNGNFRFELLAASKMSAKRDMQQAWPLVSHAILNPALIQAMAVLKLKPNMQAIIRDMLETFGFRNRNDWFVPMTPQEVQASQQPQNIEIIKELMKSQREKQRSDDKAQMMEHAQIAKIAEVVIDQFFKALVEGKPGPGLAVSRALNTIGAQDAFLNNAPQIPGNQPPTEMQQ